MNLHMGKHIMQGKITPVPLTDTIKTHVEDMARKQGITHVKFTNKTGLKLPITDWIAGVDYNEYYKNNKENGL